MNPFEVNKVNSSENNIINSHSLKGKDLDVKKSEKDVSVSKNGMTKPTIELDDFFAYLDPKVVEKIMQTPEASRARIVKDVNQYEYEINGAENILNSLG
jgi:hypothetical protein